MHDPLTVAHEIYLGRKKRKNGDYKTPFITIWHKDPCTDGSDDSCGWFIRARHSDQKILNKIKKEFEFNYKNNYWFDKKGNQIFSTIGVMMEMYNTAAWIHFKHNRKKRTRFMQKHCASIIQTAENPTDCLGDYITGKFYDDLSNPERFEGMAGWVYADILRKERKWYRHPKWHIHHWRIQFHPFQRLKRRFWDKCSVCGKRGFKGAAFSNWGGTKMWHEECQQAIENPLR